MRGDLSPRCNADPLALVQRIRAGDRTAEDDLVKFFYSRVLVQVCWRVRDREDCRELANDVLMGVVTALRLGRVRDVERLSAFVSGIIRNLANRHLRGRLRRPAEQGYRSVDAELLAADPLGSMELGELPGPIRVVLARLGQLDRRIVMMTVVEGFSCGDVASALGLKPEAVRARKSRAMRKLLAGLTREKTGARPEPGADARSQAGAA